MFSRPRKETSASTSKHFFSSLVGFPLPPSTQILLWLATFHFMRIFLFFHPRRDPRVVSNRRRGRSKQNQMQPCKKVPEIGGH
jgi:hypothetical protein